MNTCMDSLIKSKSSEFVVRRLRLEDRFVVCCLLFRLYEGRGVQSQHGLAERQDYTLSSLSFRALFQGDVQKPTHVWLQY